METGIKKAVCVAGTQTALAELIGVTPQAVQKWVTQGFVPGQRCREVESALGGKVSRYELNPTVFGDVPATAQY